VGYPGPCLSNARIEWVKRPEESNRNIKYWSPNSVAQAQSAAIPLKWADYSWEQQGWGDKPKFGFSPSNYSQNFNFGNNAYYGVPTPRALFNRQDNLQSGWIFEQGQYKQANNWEPYNGGAMKGGDWKQIYQGNGFNRGYANQGYAQGYANQGYAAQSNSAEDVQFKSAYKPDYAWVKNLTDGSG